MTVSETSAHWGTYRVEVSADGRRILAATPYDDDPDASPAIGNVADAHDAPSRVRRPAVRRSWLENGPGADASRGRPGDAFVEVDWDTALELTARELERVRGVHGDSAVFGGSYGWGSAGRFHHAQSQLHRFLNLTGGYTRSVNSYSRGASIVLLPHLVGRAADLDLRARPVPWHEIEEHTDLLVTFGGLRRSNTWVVPGGHDRHIASGRARRMAGSTHVVSLSALRDDAFHDVGAEWIGVMPGTDTAVLLALIHVLDAEGLADEGFLSRFTTGAERIRRQVRGDDDGVPKTPEWAESISRTPAAAIRDLARRMAAGRTLVNVAFSLQRGEHGEHAVHAALALAAFLGQIGLPGGGFAHGYGSMGDYGVGVVGAKLPVFDQGVNPVDAFIPCARISDLLLHPGEAYAYDGRTLRYPSIALAYWAGGNPFHHHQDLGRLRAAIARLETFIVHETHWTATAKHADIVLPATSTLERDDVAAGAGDRRLRAVRAAATPVGEARDEFRILSGLADRLGRGEAFHEGRDAGAWLRHLYERWREAPQSPPAPPFDEFWEEGGAPLPQDPYPDAVFSRFRADPAAHPLETPSGRIELHSDVIAGFGLVEVPGHPVWTERTQWWGAPDAATFDIHLLCNQPSHRLHSQHDMGAASRSTKVAGREPLRLHPDDAAARGIRAGDVVRVRSPRGSLLAGAVLTHDVLPGAAQMSTGAWFDPSRPDIADCIAGNVNVLTHDVGTTPLSQGSSGAHVLVAVERWDGEVPRVAAYDPPAFAPHAAIAQ
ncbi:molybdopterin-dependent oxidoreductase [Microbacterium gilvum]|uniref:Molybdopterin guanine dinucleotide-containing S/N-oxide reductase n=1 Tax=Microbacterium gilvum TaxID=1336204 RepID=A0ABP9AC24_9MICO